MRSSRRATLLSILPLVGLVATGAAAQRTANPAAAATTAAVATAVATSGDRASLIAALLAADSAHSRQASAGMRDGLAARFAADVVLLWPDQPLASGRAAAEAVIASIPDVGGQSMRWAPAFADVSDDGSIGYSWGAGERATVADSGTVLIPFRYIAAWRRGADGDWRIAAWALAPVGGAAMRGSWAGLAGRVPPPCASAAPPVAVPVAAPAMTDARFALLGVDGDFATLSATSGTSPAFRRYMAPAGVLIGPAPKLACGPSSLADAPAGEPGALTWTPRIAHLAPSGDLGFTVGVATSRRGTQLSHSKYLTIWKRQPDGRWLFVADGGNDLPHPSPSPMPEE